TSIVVANASGVQWLWNQTQTKPDMLSTITDGYGKKISVSYLPMTYPDTYAKKSGSAYPERDFISTRYLVYQTKQTDGNFDQYVKGYSYEGARTDIHGHGFLGFSRITVNNSFIDGTTQVTDYNTNWPLQGTAAKQEKKANGVTIARTEFFYQDQSMVSGVHDVRETSEVTTDFTVNGVQAHQRGKELQYDAYGNVSQVLDRGDLNMSQWDLYTNTTYQNDAAHWRLGY